MEGAESVSEKHAVVLSGGGAFGAFELGVLRALVNGDSPATGHKALQLQILTGTSVGAYNAAVLASKGGLSWKASVAYLEDVWLNRVAGFLYNGVDRIRGNPLPMIDPRYWIRPPLRPLLEASTDAAFLSYDTGRRLVHFLTSKGSLVRRMIDMFDLGSLVSVDPLEDLVRDTISFQELQRSNRVLKIAATNWLSGKLRIFCHDPGVPDSEWKVPEEALTEKIWPQALMASAAIPGVFPPVEINGTAHVDGGVSMNTPLKPAIKHRATVIHLVLLNQDVSRDSVAVGPPNTVDTMARTLDLYIAAATANDLDEVQFRNQRRFQKASESGRQYRPITVHRYNPHHSLGGVTGMLDFRKSTLLEHIEAGEKAAIQHNCELDGCVLPPA